MPTKSKVDSKPATKAPAKSAPKKTVASKKVEEPVPVKVEEPVVEVSQVAVEETPDSAMKEFGEFQQRLSTLRTTLSNLLQDFKVLQKKTERELKTAQKAGLKRKRKTGTRQPSGFVKPTLISNELADFLGKPKGSELARTEVTREINSYIRTHSLQDPANGRKINPDAKLSKLLSIKGTDELTYFNLQRYMSPHFQKNGDKPLNG